MADRSQTVDRALQLLDVVASDGPMTLGDAAARLGVGRTVLRRLVTSLEGAGLLRRSDEGLTIGFGALHLASAVATPLRDAARRPLEALSDRFEETALLAVRDGDDMLAIDQVVPSTRLVSVRYSPGTRHPMSVGAHGRAMATHQPVRTDGELEPGVTGVAAAIHDASGRAIAAVGLVAPTQRFPDERLVTDAVAETATEISRRLAAPLPVS